MNLFCKPFDLTLKKRLSFNVVELLDYPRVVLCIYICIYMIPQHVHGILRNFYLDFTYNYMFYVINTVKIGPIFVKKSLKRKKIIPFRLTPICFHWHYILLYIHQLPFPSYTTGIISCRYSSYFYFIFYTFSTVRLFLYNTQTTN